eukprot:1108225-Prorocentrum_minimum.AAC.1
MASIDDWCTRLRRSEKRRGEKAEYTKAAEDRKQAEARTALARARVKEAKAACMQAEAAMVEARRRKDEVESDYTRAEDEEAEYRCIEAAVATAAAVRRRAEEAEAELRRTEADVATAKARAASRRRAEAEAEAQPRRALGGAEAGGSSTESDPVCQLVARVHGGGELGQAGRNALAEVRRLASRSDADRVALVNRGVVEPLVQLLRTGNAEGKTMAARALRHLARNDGNKVTIAGAGA